jgi:hypothetical protein
VQFIEGYSIVHVLWFLFRITGGPSFFDVRSLHRGATVVYRKSPNDGQNNLDSLPQIPESRRENTV